MLWDSTECPLHQTLPRKDSPVWFAVTLRWGIKKSFGGFMMRLRRWNICHKPPCRSLCSPQLHSPHSTPAHILSYSLPWKNSALLLDCPYMYHVQIGARPGVWLYPAFHPCHGFLACGMHWPTRWNLQHGQTNGYLSSWAQYVSAQTLEKMPRGTLIESMRAQSIPVSSVSHRVRTSRPLIIYDMMPWRHSHPMEEIPEQPCVQCGPQSQVQ